MDEVDPRAGRTPAWLVIEQAYATPAQRRAGGPDVGDGERHLLDTGPVAVEELPDRRVRAQRGQQLDAVGPVADGEHRLTYPLLLVFLGVYAPEAEHPAVVRDRRVQVSHGDPDMVDAQYPDGGQVGGCDGARSRVRGGVHGDSLTELPLSRHDVGGSSQ